MECFLSYYLRSSFKTRRIQFVELEITGFYEFSIHSLLVVWSVDLGLGLSGIFSVLGRGKIISCMNI